MLWTQGRTRTVPATEVGRGGSTRVREVDALGWSLTGSLGGSQFRPQAGCSTSWGPSATLKLETMAVHQDVWASKDKREPTVQNEDGSMGHCYERIFLTSWKTLLYFS